MLKIQFKKISIIIEREFSTRVRKKSFIVMSLLGPLLFASIFILPTWFAKMEDTSVKNIVVVDSSHLFVGKIPDTETMKFHWVFDQNIEDVKKNFKKDGYWGALYVSHIITYTPNAVELYTYSQPGLGVRLHIQQAIEKECERQKILANNIVDFDRILQSVKTNIEIRTFQLEDNGMQKEGNSELATAVGYISGFLIYMFIFMFGAQVMRGVLEEKSSRIIEVMVSSVKPIELMAGKIVGIALVGLTQFAIWAVLTLGIVAVAQKSLFPDLSKTQTEKAISQDIMNGGTFKELKADEQTQEMLDNKKTSELHNVFGSFKYINFGVIIASFIFFFICGYLLYGSLFAAIGAISEAETDTQQFMLPVTIPLVLAIFVLINTIQNPESSLSFWFSMIPLTSPIVMMARIPFGVPWEQVLLSSVILIATIVGFMAIAAKIYRTGILMYGKKVTYGEIWKWLRYKN